MTGMTRVSPVSSWYWVRTLSITMRGHQSFVDAGPIMPFDCLVVECPIEEPLRLGFEARIVKKPGQRNQPIEIIRPPFERFALSTQPAAIGADVGPGLVQMAAEAVGLNAKLTLKPAGGAN